MTPFPHQLAGAEFLAARDRALLADAPRVGKTGAAIIAADYRQALDVLVVTTASGRPVWERAFRDWSGFDVPTGAYYGGGLDPKVRRLIVSWGVLHKLLPELVQRRWDVVIADESHNAKSLEAQRTRALYGDLPNRTAAFWCLTGTPIPNAPNDLYPMLRRLAPKRLEVQGDWPDVTSYEDFLRRYCIVRPKRLSRWRTIQVVVGSRNLDELRARMEGFWLRRTQADIGITAPIYEVLPIHIDGARRRTIEAEIADAEGILAAAETGETRGLDIQLGTLRRLTGTIKAHGVARLVAEEFDGGLDKIVIMAWHKAVLNHLHEALSAYGVVRVDGETSAKNRLAAADAFASDPKVKVFLGQILAAGEAIDLSAAADLIFAESSFVPKDMQQAALRVTNINQKRQPRVRVAAIEGTIDDALQTIITRKVATIKELLKT